jgi:hypothetical protein
MSTDRVLLKLTFFTCILVLVELDLHEFECIMWKYHLHISSCKLQYVFNLNLVFGVHCPSTLIIFHSIVT